MAERRAEAEEQAGEAAREGRIAEDVHDAKLTCEETENLHEAVAALAEEKEARVREAWDRLRHCRTRTGGGEGRHSSMARAGGEAVVGPAVQPTREAGGSADTADAGKRDAGSQTCVEGGRGGSSRPRPPSPPTAEEGEAPPRRGRALNIRGPRLLAPPQ